MMNNNITQIYRKDAKGCFVEALNDAFRYGKFHLAFAKYDRSKPPGQRQHDYTPIFIDVGSMLSLCQDYKSGKLEYNLSVARGNPGSYQYLFQVMGGTYAKDLVGTKQQRGDGMSLSRCCLLQPGKSKDLLFTATSGPGREDVPPGGRPGTGIIKPVYGNRPETSVAIPFSLPEFGQMLLVLEKHYSAWLTACYSAMAVHFEGDPAINGWNPYRN